VKSGQSAVNPARNRSKPGQDGVKIRAGQSYRRSAALSLPAGRSRRRWALETRAKIRREPHRCADSV